MIKNENEIKQSINESINNYLINNVARLDDSKANIMNIISNENTSYLIYNFLVENNEDSKKLWLIKIMENIINEIKNENLNFIKSVFSKIWNIIYMPNSIFIKNHILELIKSIKDLNFFTYNDYNELVLWVINNVDKCYITNIYILLKVYENKFFENDFYNDEFFMKLFSVINFIYIKIKEDLNDNISMFINNYDKLFTLKLFIKYLKKIIYYFKYTNKRIDLFTNQLNYILTNTDIIDFNFYCLSLNFNNYNIIITNCENQKILKELNFIKSIIIDFLKLNFDENFQNKIYLLVEKVIIELKNYFILNINNLSEKNFKRNDLINNLIIFLDNKIKNIEFFDIFKKYNEDIYVYIIIPSYILDTEQYKEFNDNPYEFYEDLIDIFSYSNGDNFLVNITKLYIKLTENIDNFLAISHQYIINITKLLLNNDQTFLEKYNKDNFSTFLQKLNKENLLFLLYCLLTVNSNNLRDNLFIEETTSIYNIFEKFKNEYTIINVVGLTFYLQITSKRLFSIDKLENIMNYYIEFLIENMNENILICLEKIFYYILEDLEIENKIKIFNNNNFLNKILSKNKLNNIASIKLLHLILKNYSDFRYIKEEIIKIIFNFGNIILHNLNNIDDNINEFFNFLITVSKNKEFVINNYDLILQSINNILLKYANIDNLDINQLDTVIINIINFTNKFYESYWNILDYLLNYCGQNKNNYNTIKTKLKLIYIICKYGFQIIINNTHIMNKMNEFSIFKNKDYSKYNIFITIIIFEFFNSKVNYESVKHIFNIVKSNVNYLSYDSLDINIILFFYWINFKYKLILNLFDEVLWKNIINNLIEYVNDLSNNFEYKLYINSTLNLLSEDLLKNIDEYSFISIFKYNIRLLKNISNNTKIEPSVIKDNSLNSDYSLNELDNINKKNNKIIYKILKFNSTIININEIDKLNYLVDNIKAKENNFFDRYKFKFNTIELEFLENLFNKNYKKVYDEKNNEKWRKIVKLKK